MKDLAILLGSTIIVVLIWTGIETAQVTGQSYAPKDLLEISSPISGTIDADFISAYEH